jgi:predicted phosphoribosyltransferase
MQRFADRYDAGRQLADRLLEYANRADVVVLALPRGGVPVGFEIAERLRVPLEVFLVRKLGVPGQEELAMGAIASGDVRVLNVGVLLAAGVPDSEIERVAAREREELARRERMYRGDRPPVDVRGRVAILVDDGLATGATMRAAAAALRRQHPSRRVVAVPVAARDACAELRADVDEVVCASTPEPFNAVGLWYDDFAETTDAEVQALLRRAADRSARAA